MTDEFDEDLTVAVECWPQLPTHIKLAILALIESAGGVDIIVRRPSSVANSAGSRP